jgi:hypothetical protein
MKKITELDARKWLMVAYTNTVNLDYFTQKHMGNVSGHNVFAVCAKELGLIQTNGRKGSSWVDLDNLPDDVMAKALFDRYTEYQGETHKKYAAKQTPGLQEDVQELISQSKQLDQRFDDLLKVLHMMSDESVKINKRLESMESMWATEASE